MERYILAGDEAGNPGISPKTSNTFVYGGYVISEDNVNIAIRAWRKVKDEFCGDESVELKWKHFFIEENHPLPNPLLFSNRIAREQLANIVLDYMLKEAPIMPVAVYSRKDKATDDFIIESKKGNRKINDDDVWLMPVAQFATFLNAKNAKGRLCFDKLGSEKQMERRQLSWSNIIMAIRNEEYPENALINRRKLLSIDDTIDFLDSTDEEIIQIADFVCGVIWTAWEVNGSYLERLLNKYGDNATLQGLGIASIE